MDFNIDIRRKQLESLDQFISSSRDKLQSFLDHFGWTADKIVEDAQYITCPYNNAHKLLADKTDDHNEKCKLKSAGYNIEENFLSEPSTDSKEGRIKIDTVKKIEVLSHALTQTPYFQTAWNGQDPDPQTYNRLVTTFSRDERLALYNYSVSNTKGPQIVPEFDASIGSERENNTSFTEEALLSFERDIKRRSVKYKPIHTNHKNYKEILREVINSQMQQYEDWLIEKTQCKGPHTPEYYNNKEEYEDRINKNESFEKAQEISERPHSSFSRVSNHSSSSRSTVKRNRSMKYSPRRSRNNSHEGKRAYYHKEDSSYLKTKALSKYEHNEEDSRESNTSKFSISHKSENAIYTYDREDFFGDHSRDSSVHSSYKYKERKKSSSLSGKKRRSRSYSNDRAMKKHHRKHRSRSRHRSEEHKSNRDKSSKYRSRRYEKYESR